MDLSAVQFLQVVTCHSFKLHCLESSLLSGCHVGVQCIVISFHITLSSQYGHSVDLFIH